jgi:hypothetical protein
MRIAAFARDAKRRRRGAADAPIRIVPRLAKWTKRTVAMGVRPSAAPPLRGGRGGARRAEGDTKPLDRASGDRAPDPPTAPPLNSQRNLE